MEVNCSKIRSATSWTLVVHCSTQQGNIGQVKRWVVADVPGRGLIQWEVTKGKSQIAVAHDRGREKRLIRLRWAGDGHVGYRCVRILRHVTCCGLGLTTTISRHRDRMVFCHCVWPAAAGACASLLRRNGTGKRQVKCKPYGKAHFEAGMNHKVTFRRNNGRVFSQNRPFSAMPRARYYSPRNNGQSLET